MVHAQTRIHRMETNVNEKIDKYLDLATELKKLWNMKATLIPVVFDALRTVSLG